MTYVAPERPLGRTYDSKGRELSCRHTDGTGWDRTYDSEGRMLSYRHTDGTGWDRTYDSEGRVLSYRRTDGTGWDTLAHCVYLLSYTTEGKYVAGCRGPFTRAEALAHWNRPDERAKVFTAAILAHKES